MMVSCSRVTWSLVSIELYCRMYLTLLWQGDLPTSFIRNDRYACTLATVLVTIAYIKRSTHCRSRFDSNTKVILLGVDFPGSIIGS